MPDRTIPTTHPNATRSAAAEAQLHHETPTARPVGVPQLLHPNAIIMAVARLTDRDLQCMTARDLLDMILMTSRPGSATERTELAAKDQPTLRRMCFYVRRGCRTEINAYAREHGRPAHFHDAH